MTASFLGSILVCGPAAAQTMEVSVLGGLTQSYYHYDSNLGINCHYGSSFGAGATVAFEVAPYVNLESGLLYISNSYSVTSGSTTQDHTLRFVDFPVLLRFNPVTELSLYFGPYYGFQAGSNASDIGLMTGAGIRYGLSSSWKLRLDGLYQFGFANLDTSISSQTSRNFIFLAGLSFETW